MDKLFSKIYGCEAAANIANAMGDLPEGKTYEEIEKLYGFVDKMMPQEKTAHVRKDQFGHDLVYHAHSRPPGMTEDGHERHRLVTNAILKKGGRINIMDLAQTWADDIKPEKFGYLLGPQDQVIYYAIKAGIPPWEVGRYASWPGFIGTSKMILPIGCINACNPEAAAADAHDLGRIKDARGLRRNYALEVCAGLAAACAEALKPDSTVDAVIKTALNCLSDNPRKEIEQHLEWAHKAKDWKELRPLFQEKYNRFPISDAVEVLGSGLALLYMARGNPKDAILYSVNFGRDCDCRAYVAGGLAGALKGIEEVPADWVKIIEEQVVTDPYSVSTKTAKAVAEGLYKAAMNTANQYKEVTAMIDKLTS